MNSFRPFNWLPRSSVVGFLLAIGFLFAAVAAADNNWPPPKVTQSHRVLVRGLEADDVAVVTEETAKPSVAGIDKRVAALPGLSEKERVQVLKRAEEHFAQTLEKMKDALLPTGMEPTVKQEKLDAMLDLFVALHARIAKGGLDDERRRNLRQEVDALAEKLVRALAQPAPKQDTGAVMGKTRGGLAEGAYYGIFKEFYEMDLRRRKGKGPSAELWEALARSCNAKCRIEKPLELKIAGPYLLRLRLIQAQCYLFASVQRYVAGQNEGHLTNYRKGIRLLQMLYRVRPADLGRMPKPIDKANNVYYFNAGVSDWDPGDNKFWRSTHGMADALLAEFCPWGVEMYMFLRQLRLTRYIDWATLVPYCKPDVKEVGPICVVPEDVVPLNIRKDAEEIASGQYRCYCAGPGNKAQYKQVRTEWLRPPKVVHSICFLSPRAFGLTTSQKIDLGWKGFQLVTLGPLALIGDYAQDRIVEELGTLFKKRPDATYYIYASAAVVNTADNWGFDKSWLLEFKPEFKKAKFSKMLLCHVLQMYEGQDMKRLFSGRPPTFEILRKNSDDPRTYDNSSMAHVIFRTDVHGFEKVKEDEYPRAWAVARFYQLAPKVLAGDMNGYDLFQRPICPLRRKSDYLKGDIFVLTRTWKALPYDDEQTLGFRRIVTDFTPKAQSLTMTVPQELREAWDKAIEPKESVIAVLRYAASGKPVPHSARPVSGLKVHWWLHPSPQYKDGKPASPYCHPDKLRTKYIVEFLRCKFKSGKPGGYDWKKPVKSFGRNEAVFWRKKGEPTGKLTMTKIGPHDMIQEVKLKSPDPLESPDLPFKLCHVNVRVAAHVKYETGESHGMKEFKWVAVGKFNGNKFTGKISHKGGREKSKETVTGTVTVLLGPRNKEVKCGKISSKIANFTATYNRKTVNLDTVEETGPYTTDTTVTLSGSNIPVNEKSPLLTTKIPPLDRIARLPRLQMQYRWAALAYTVSGEAAGKVKVTFKQNRKTNKWSENRRLVSVKPSPNAYVSIYFTFQ